MSDAAVEYCSPSASLRNVVARINMNSKLNSFHYLQFLPILQT
jgi:hypothetical protein